MKLAKLVSMLLFLSFTSVVFSQAVEARPATDWRTKSTELSTTGDCTRRAFRAMNNFNLESSASGEFGVYGQDREVGLYVLCLNNGALAAIFCASDESSTRICDKIAKYMEP